MGLFALAARFKYSRASICKNFWPVIVTPSKKSTINTKTVGFSLQMNWQNKIEFLVFVLGSEQKKNQLRSFSTL